MEDTDIANELKHWGILDMHWYHRRFQNPDGSLTEAGRERYGVGPARKKASKAEEAASKYNKQNKHNKVNNSYSDEDINKKQKKVNDSYHDGDGNRKQEKVNNDSYQNTDVARKPNNDKKHKIDNKVKSAALAFNLMRPEDLSDEDLKTISYRYKKQADFYRSQNEYLQSRRDYERLMNPPKKESEFVKKVLVQPVENVMAKNVEFILMSMGANFVDATGSKYMDEYLKWIFKQNNNSKPNQQNNTQQNYQNDNNYHNKNRH